MRRKPNPTQRRCDITDAAIALLAEDGVKGLSHLKVDRKAGLPDGTTSVYYRTRTALLHASAQRVVELDLAALHEIADTIRGISDPHVSPLARALLRVSTEPYLTRSKARHELAMQATRDPDLAEVLQPGRQAFGRLLQAIVAHYTPAGDELNPAMHADLTDAAATYLSGVMLRLVQGDRSVDPLRVDAHLRALAKGLPYGKPAVGDCTPSPPSALTDAEHG